MLKINNMIARILLVILALGLIAYQLVKINKLKKEKENAKSNKLLNLKLK